MGLLFRPVCLPSCFAWDREVGRVDGAVLVVAYVSYVVLIWMSEWRLPSLGEIGELEEAATSGATPGRIAGLGLDVVGTAAILVGATMLVEAIRCFTDLEADRTRLSRTIVGLGTPSAGRPGMVVGAPGICDAVVAAVIGSFAYNATMTLGAAAVVTPPGISDATLRRVLVLGMIAALTLVLGLGTGADA